MTAKNSCTTRIRGSTLRGKVTQAGVQCYFNVPYAQPPVGDRRWARPVALSKEHYYGDLDCTKFGAICPQPRVLLDGRSISHAPRHAQLSEDCLKINIWVPPGRPPARGWPVFTWIHGGWLQIGNPMQDTSLSFDGLLGAGEKDFGLRAIVVAIGYRLNVFGFLAGDACAGNFGLWDQRCGIEWVRDNIGHFGGDGGNLTLAGLSAGANSSHLQVHHELFAPAAVRQGATFNKVVMISNAVSAQSKPRHMAHGQFDELRRALGVDDKLTSADALDAMRRVPWEKLVEVIHTLKTKAFRHVTSDDDFVHPDMVQRALDGTFAAAIRRRGFLIVNGEVEHEEATYRGYHPPADPADPHSFQTALEDYYSESVSRNLMRHFGYPEVAGLPSDPAARRNELWDQFGEIVAAAQVRASTRHFATSLMQDAGDAQKDALPQVLRYRISWRPHAIVQAGVAGLPKDAYRSARLPYPRKAKGGAEDGPKTAKTQPPLVPHGSDLSIWFYQAHLGYTDGDRALVKRWLRPFKTLIESPPGGALARDATEAAAARDAAQEIAKHWDTKSLKQVRHLKPDGSIEVVDDRWYDDLQPVFDVLMPKAQTAEQTKAPQLATAKL